MNNFILLMSIFENKLFNKVVSIIGLLMLLLTGVFSFGQTTYTGSLSTSSAQFSSSPQALTLSSVSWTLTNNGGFYGVDGTKGQQIGSSGSPATSMSFATSGISGTITAVKITTSGAASVVATVGVTVGGSAYGGSAQSITASNTQYTFSGSATGAISINWSQTSSKALYINQVQIVYSTGITSNAVVGNWSSTSSWVGGVVPLSADNVTIVSGATITMDTTTSGINTRNSGTSTTVNTGGTLATSVQYINSGTTTINGSFQLNAGGYTNSGNNFVYGSAGKLVFNNTSSYGVNNTDQYWPTSSGPVDVTILQGGMTLNSGANRTVTGVFQTAAAVTLTSATLTLNGTVKINTGGSFINTPTYGSSSTLIYNTGAAYTRGNEWTTATSGAGYPANVQVSTASTIVNMGSTSAQCSGSITIDAGTTLNTTSAGLTVLGSITTNGTISLGGDVTLSGTSSSNWTVGASGTQTNNSKAVFFTGVTGTQNIIKTGGGTIFFDYLVISKATSGSVVLATSPNATSVTLNTTSGNVLQLKGLGSLDLNGNTLALNNSGGGIYVDGARTITSTIAGGKLDINQYKFVANNSGTGALTIGANVTVNLNANGNFDFGKSGSTFITTLNGTLSINSTTSCFVNTNAPIYGTGSLLKYNSGGTYGRGLEWSTTSGAGYPYDVQVSNSTTLNYPNTGTGAFTTALATARDLTIDALSSLYMDYGSSSNKSAPLTIGRNITLSGNMSLGDAVGGDLNVAGNWTRTGVFTPNTRAVTFNGTSLQTITGVTTFDYLTLNNSTGLTLANNVTINLTLALTSGKITLGANDLTVGSSGTITGASTSNYIIVASTGQLKRTVGASNILFPVGNTAYNPITFNNSGTSDVYGVRVANGAITTGANNTKTISRSWVTTEAVSGGSNLSVVAQYNTGETNSGFATATNNFVGFYNGSSWSQVAATHAGSNPFTVTSNSNISPSNLTTGTQYFAIGRDNGFLSIASNFVITAISPTSPTAGSGFSVTVQSQDTYGAVANVAASTAFSLTTNGNAGAISGTTTGTIAAGTNSITITGVILASSGTGVTLTSTVTSGDSLTAGTSSTFLVLDAASQLAFVSVPGTGNVGVNLTSFTVQAKRPDGSVDNTFTGSITISKATGSGSLSGTLTASAVAGIATFSSAQFDTAGTYTLSVTSGSLTSATSGNIVITLVPVALYKEDFGTSSTVALPYSYGTNATGSGVLNSNLSTPSWNQTISSANFAGSAGGAMTSTLSGTSVVVTATFNVATGYKLTPSSIGYNYRISGTGPTTLNVSIANISGSTSISSVTTTRSGAFVGVTTSNFISSSIELTGTITLTLTFSGGASSSTVRLDDITLNGNVTCVQPVAYDVTGSGNGCVTTGVAVGLSNSQVGVSYQLKNGSSNIGSAVAGTGVAISFGSQTTAATYTVVASNTNGSCNYTLDMTGSAVVTLDPASVAGTASGTTSICSGNSTTIGLSGYTGTIQWQQSLNGTSGWTNVSGGSGATTDSYTTAALTSTTYYRALVTSGSCASVPSGNITVTVNAIPSASIASNNGPSICSGSDAMFTVSGTTSDVITYNLNGASNTTATLTGSTMNIIVSGVTTAQTFNLVSVSNGLCSANIGTSSSITLETTSWNGSAWDNGLPNSSKAVIFTGNYTMSSNFSACSISIANNAVVSVDSGKNVSLYGGITVSSGSSFILNNNANLYQSDASSVNTGNIIVKRDSNPLIRLDYTMWSSPVAGQKLLAFSPLTSISPTIRFYTYNSTTNSYNSVSSPSTTDFDTGKGYLIRLPYNHPTASVVWSGSFTGVPNNGTKTISLANVDETHQYNAVGNPYPSPISISQFASDNSSNIEPTIYFWRKTNNATNPSYCTWNSASQTFGSNGETYATSPNGIIHTGQGFIVEAKGSATSLEFNNGQRIVNNTNHFLKTSNTTVNTTTESHRIWLNLTGAATEYSQAVVGYFTNATQGADDYDSKLFNDGNIALSSKIGVSDYVIQGRPVPFDASDIVPLNYRVTTAGTYTFTIDHVDGLFTAAAQEVYIKDNLDGSYHNITTSPYSFASAAGTFSNRFELVYQNLLSFNEINFTANSIVVYHQQNDVVISTGSTNMSTIKIYDIRGRLLIEKKDVNASETRLNIGSTNQVLLIQVTTIDGLKATKKVVN